MSTHILRGDAQVVRDLWTITPVAANSATYTLTINTKSVTYTADGSALVAEITAGLVAAATASTAPPEFAEFTWSDITTAITATGNTSGKPGVISASASAGSLTSVHTTTAKGPEHFIAENMNSGSLPSSADTLILQDLAPSVKYALANSSIVLALLDIRADFTGQIGLPAINSDGTSYYEYRAKSLAIGATELRIGDGNGAGSPGIRLDLGSGQTLAQVLKTGNSSDQDYGAVQLVGTHANNELRVFGGTVDIAMGPGEVATFETITASAGTVRCGSGVTLTDVEANGNAQIEVRSAATTLTTQGNGIIRKTGSGAVTTIDIGGGVVEISAAGTITNLTVRAGKTFDASKLNVAITITNSTAYAGSSILDPNGKITWTNATACPDGADSVKFVTKKGATVKVA